MGNYNQCHCGGTLQSQGYIGPMWKTTYRCDVCRQYWAPMATAASQKFLKQVQDGLADDPDRHDVLVNYILKRGKIDMSPGETVDIAKRVHAQLTGTEYTAAQGGEAVDVEKADVSLLKVWRESSASGVWKIKRYSPKAKQAVADRADRILLLGLAESRPKAYALALQECVDPYSQHDTETNPYFYETLELPPSDEHTQQFENQQKKMAVGKAVAEAMNARAEAYAQQKGIPVAKALIELVEKEKDVLTKVAYNNHERTVPPSRLGPDA